MTCPSPSARDLHMPRSVFSITMYSQLLALPFRLVLTRHPLGSRGNLATKGSPGRRVNMYS